MSGVLIGVILALGALHIRLSIEEPTAVPDVGWRFQLEPGDKDMIHEWLDENLKHSIRIGEQANCEPTEDFTCA